MSVEFEEKMKVVTENQIQCSDKLPQLCSTGMVCLARSVGRLCDPFYVEIELPQISSKSRRFQRLLQSSIGNFFINSMFWSIAFLVVQHTQSLSEGICVHGTTWHINEITIVTCLRLTVLQSGGCWSSASVTSAAPQAGSSLSLLHGACLQEQLAPSYAEAE